MTMTTNSIRLLKAEIKREEAELQKEKSKLEELESNAKAARQKRKRQSKNVRRYPFASPDLFMRAFRATTHEKICRSLSLPKY